MEIRHGGLAIDIPDGWSDQSTLLFIAPRRRLDAPLLKTPPRPTEAVSVRFVLATRADPRLLIEEQARELDALDPGHTLLEEGPFDTGLGPGWRAVQRVTLGGVALRQVTVACVAGAVGVLATASTADAGFERVEAELDAVLRSMRRA